MMNEIQNDVFYDFLRQYDSDSECHLAGEVDYHLLRDDNPYEGLNSHRKALLAVFEQLVERDAEDQEKARKRRGEETAGQLHRWVYDIDNAQPSQLDPQTFFYCPDIVRTDYYGNVFYDADWKPDDDNFGTSVPYWYALMEPVYGRRNKPEDFRRVNGVLFPEGIGKLDIYEWTTDWSDYFDDGHEWYGASCWTVYDENMNRYVVMLVSATD